MKTGMTKEEIHSVRQSTAEASSAGAVVGKHLYVIEAQLPQAF